MKPGLVLVGLVKGVAGVACGITGVFGLAAGVGRGMGLTGFAVSAATAGCGGLLLKQAVEDMKEGLSDG